MILRFLGLAFARWHEHKVSFGLDAVWQELRPENERELKQLVANLQNFRNPLASNLRHPLYRAQAERWLQTLVCRDVTRMMSRWILGTSMRRSSGRLRGITGCWTCCV